MRSIDPLAGQRVPVVGGPERRGARHCLQRDARPAGVRAARERASGPDACKRPNASGSPASCTTRSARRSPASCCRSRGSPRRSPPTARHARGAARDRPHGRRRRAAHRARLRPEALEDLGLQSALSALATSFGEQTGIRVDRLTRSRRCLARARARRLPRRAGGADQRRASRAWPPASTSRCAATDDRTVLSVRDDGRGLPPAALSSSHGIRGMRERAMLIGAR